MTILVRTDSGGHIGVGHVSRCSALADEIIKLGHKVIFLVKDHHGSNYQFINKNIKVIKLRLDNNHIIENNKYSSWSGSKVQDEVNEINSVIDNIGHVDLLIIDHYGLDSKIESKLNVESLLVIDDLENRFHYCDFLVDPALCYDSSAYMKLMKKKETKLLLGPKYTILRSEFRKKRPLNFKRIEKVRDIFAYFGSTDPTSEALKLVKAFEESNLNINLKVLTSANNKDYSQIKSIIERCPNIKLLAPTKTISDYILEADVTIGACGTSFWERACLGVGSFVVKTAENQDRNVKGILSQNAAIFVGDGFKTDERTWRGVLNNLIDIGPINEAAENSYKLCDGLGASRIIKEVLNDKL